MMNINGLFVWTLGSVIRVIQLISTLKKLFVLYLTITQIITHWIQNKNTILKITRITGSLVFYLFLLLFSFAYTFLNPVTMTKIAQTPVTKNAKPTYVIKRTSGLCEWLLRSVTQWLNQLDPQSSFVCGSVSHIT